MAARLDFHDSEGRAISANARAIRLVVEAALLIRNVLEIFLGRLSERVILAVGSQSSLAK